MKKIEEYGLKLKSNVNNTNKLKSVNSHINYLRHILKKKNIKLLYEKTDFKSYNDHDSFFELYDLLMYEEWLKGE